MDLKKFFAAALTILGIVALIYAAFSFLRTDDPDWKVLIVYGVLGLIFFSSGISLVKGMDNGKSRE